MRNLAETRTPIEANRPGAARVNQVQPADLEYLPYGPGDGERAGEPGCEVVATFGEVEAEYASIRRGAGLLDCPQRGTLLIQGADRRDFLNRMLTNELADLESGMMREAFWLNRKGRIEADVTLVELGDHLLATLDIHQADATVRTLSEFIFTEDVVIKDVSSEMHCIGIHGPRALELIAAASGDEAFTLGQHCAAQEVIAQHDVVIARHDQTGALALDCMVDYDAAATVWQHLLATGDALADSGGRVRPVGWYAWNIARIEAGLPVFNIDFGPTNLPHESGVLQQRVSFKKGCYLGQEIVARMESLGKPKQMLRGLRMASDALPVADAQVFARTEQGEMGDQVGVVTSSTLSPMLGATPIAFAMLKTDAAELGATVLVNAEGRQAEATVQELRFLPQPATTS